LNTFIEEETAKIKISCSCLEENEFITMNLFDYLSDVKNFKNSNMCQFHSDEKSEYFCLNCENWLCKDCNENHSKEICEKEYYNNIDIEKLFCEKHTTKKIILCKQCMIIYCQTCFIHHNNRNKIKHKGTNIDIYLTEERINEKYNKFQLYMDEMPVLKNGLKDNLLKDISDKNDKDIQQYKIILQEKYLIYKNINEQIRFLFELFIKNCENITNNFILNRKFIYDIILNTSATKLPIIKPNVILSFLTRKAIVDSIIKVISIPEVLIAPSLKNPIDITLIDLNNINKLKAIKPNPIYFFIWFTLLVSLTHYY
jgi:hypothetical protein